MVDFDGSYCFVGNNAEVKKVVMENISKQLGIPVARLRYQI